MKKLMRLCGVLGALLWGTQISASSLKSKGDDLPEIQGILGTKEGFAVFATIGGGKVQQLTMIGQKLGPYELVGVDAVQAFADFKKEGGATVRIYVPEGRVVPSAATEPDPNKIEIPPLAAFTKFVIADELRGNPAVEQKIRAIIDRAVNNPRLTSEERREVLNRYVSGEVVLVVEAPFTVRIYPKGSNAIPAKRGS